MKGRTGPPGPRPKPKQRPGSSQDQQQPEILTAEQLVDRYGGPCYRIKKCSYKDATRIAGASHNNGIQACINAIKTMELPEINAAGTIIDVLRELEIKP